jgi:predicted DNA-binding transcriptional regulator YafY
VFELLFATRGRDRTAAELADDVGVTLRAAQHGLATIVRSGIPIRVRTDVFGVTRYRLDRIQIDHLPTIRSDERPQKIAG